MYIKRIVDSKLLNNEDANGLFWLTGSQKFKNGWEANTFAAYHDLNVLVLYNEKGELLTETNKNKTIAFYMFEEDEVPSMIKTRLMSFSKFYSMIKDNGIEFLDYYYDSKDREWSWHLDAYKAFTKEKIDEYLENNKDSRYDFLNQ